VTTYCSVNPFPKAKFCGASSGAIVKVGCAVCKKRLRITDVDHHKKITVQHVGIPHASLRANGKDGQNTFLIYKERLAYSSSCQWVCHPLNTICVNWRLILMKLSMNILTLEITFVFYPTFQI
jgi:hypothetical protein